MDFELKKTSDRTGVLSFFENYNQQVLKSACVIDNADDHEDHQGFGLAVTSTPYPKKAGHSKSISKRQENIENEICSQTADSNGLSVSKVLAVLEDRRKLETIAKHRAVLISQIEKLEERRANDEAQLQAVIKEKSSKLCEKRLRELREEEALATERKQRQELQQQKHAQRVSIRDEQIKAAELQKREAEAERKKKLAEKAKFAEEVQRYVNKFSEVCQKIYLEYQSCQATGPIVNNVKPLHMCMQTLIQRGKSLNIEQSDVESAKDMCAKVNLIYSNILEEVAKLKRQEEERNAVRQQDLNQSQNNVSHLPEVQVVSSEVVKDSVNGLLDCADKEALQWYQELKRYKEDNEKLFEQLIKDDSLKKYRFDCQKAVNIPVNAISPVSASHLRDKLQKLTLLLSGQPVVIGDGIRISAAQHPAGVPFCKDLLAKKFVKQGASTVSSKPEAAFAIAAVMVALWQEFPDWGQLLLAHFHQDCPYLVPVFWPQLEGQSNRHYYQSLGYTYNEDGEVEKQDKFLKRMSGMMRLYSTVLISRLPRDRQNRPHPHDLGQGWRWLTCILNLEPRPDICASLLYDFLEVAGSSMQEQYGRQYRKLLHVICKSYFPRLQKIAVSSSGPVVRLETFLQTILKQGGNKPPQGMLPVHFW